MYEGVTSEHLVNATETMAEAIVKIAKGDAEVEDYKLSTFETAATKSSYSFESPVMLKESTTTD